MINLAVVGFGLRIDGDDRMLRASFRLSFGGPSLVDRDRLRTSGGQLERIVCPVSPSRRQIGPPAFALISFTSPASRSLATALWAWARFGPAGGTRQ